MKVHARKRKLEARALLTAKTEPPGGGDGNDLTDGNNATIGEDAKDGGLNLDNISKLSF